MAKFIYDKEKGKVVEVEEVEQKPKETLQFILKGLGYPTKMLRKEEKARKNPGYTGFPEYKKKIDENTEKARAIKAGEDPEKVLGKSN